MKSAKIDKVFLASVITLALGGFFIFTSASLGLLSAGGASFSSETITQAVSLILGFTFFMLFQKSRINFGERMHFISSSLLSP